jgi:hypothetical protein
VGPSSCSFTRLDLQELRIENGNVTLRGRTRDHRGAEQLAASINKTGSLQCGAPRTERHQMMSFNTSNDVILAGISPRPIVATAPIGPSSLPSSPTAMIGRARSGCCAA